jgi:hypothetical protein
MAAFGRKQTLIRSALSGRCAPKADVRVIVSERLLMTQSGHSSEVLLDSFQFTYIPELTRFGYSSINRIHIR